MQVPCPFPLFPYAPVGYWLTLMLLVADFTNTKWCKKLKKMTETLAYGYSSESTQREISNNMTGLRWFSKVFASLCFDTLSKIPSVLERLTLSWLEIHTKGAVWVYVFKNVQVSQCLSILLSSIGRYRRLHSRVIGHWLLRALFHACSTQNHLII